MEHRPKTQLAQVREAIRRQHDSRRTEDSYSTWIKRYNFFHNKQQPSELGSAAIEASLTHLAVDQQVAASTPHQALSALRLLDRDVRNMPRV